MQRKTLSVIAGAIITVLALVFVIIVFTSSFSIKLLDDKVEIKDIFYSMDINYQDIDDVQNLTQWQVGSRVNGSDTGKLCSGNFNNSEYGKYKLYIFNDVKQFIFVKLNNGNIVVFNVGTVEETNQLYLQLVEKLDK